MRGGWGWGGLPAAEGRGYANEATASPSLWVPRAPCLSGIWPIGGAMPRWRYGQAPNPSGRQAGLAAAGLLGRCDDGEGRGGSLDGCHGHGMRGWCLPPAEPSPPLPASRAAASRGGACAV